jgi:ferrous iron transport protein B
VSCHQSSSKARKIFEINRRKNSGNNNRHLTIALAGNANVGKSVIFNQLTGSNQIIGNWPGKTVERAEGTLNFEGSDVRIIDLPGIYSFSTFSLEELVSREYIALEKPDVVINVVDASVFERNLFFSIQLMEMEAPLIICLNQMDTAKKKGITIETKKLETILDVPVVSTVAIRGEGLHQLMKKALAITQEKNKVDGHKIQYGDEVETRIEKLAQLIESEKLNFEYPSRWLAIKLLENDAKIKELVASKSQSIAHASEILAEEIALFHKEPCFAVIASERYSLASRIAGEVQKQSVVKTSFSEKLDTITTHRVIGYFTSVGVIAGLLLWTFIIGELASNLISGALSFIEPINPKLTGSIISIIWNGVFGGFVAGITLVLPFVIPFYIMLAMIEDSGILTRVAFMMDSAMHKIGLHGKALIPLILGYGCNVPAINACRIMETRRERLLAAFAITFAPCAARTILILGLVAVFVSIPWALALYAIDIALIFALGRIALRVVPGTSTGLIMEMHAFKIPSISVISKQTWARTKSIMYVVFPIYIVGSTLVQVLFAAGVLEPFSNAMSFLTVTWLGLPLITGILLILGTVRKEFILLGLVALYGGTNLGLFLSPLQLVTLAFVSVLYIPCISTIVVLFKEFGWKAAAAISFANLATAILVGGIFFRVLLLSGIL